MSSKAKARRYTPDQKKEILKFIEDFNAKNGRGGQSKAAAKFKVSQLSLSKWVNEGPATAKGPGRPAKGAATSSKDFDKKLAALKKLNGEISKAEANLAALKEEFADLVKSI